MREKLTPLQLTKINEFIEKEKLPAGFLTEDIKNKNIQVLHILKYVIENVSHIPTLFALIKDISKHKGSRENVRNTKNRCAYENELSVLDTIRLLSRRHLFTLLEIESQNSPVLSPYRPEKNPEKRMNKSCDFMGEFEREIQYFENKSYNVEDLIWGKSEEEKEKYFNGIMENPSIFQMWLIDKINEAKEKGANYLVIRFPVWSGYSSSHSETLNNKWIRDRFNFISQRSPTEFIVNSPIEIPDYLKGIFFIKPAYDLLLKFTFAPQKAI